MAGELPEDWESGEDSLANLAKLAGGTDAEDPSAAGGDSLAELPDPMADGVKDQPVCIQDPIGSHKSNRSGGTAAGTVNGRMNFSQEIPELRSGNGDTDDYGNILPSLPSAPQAKLDSLPSFERNASGAADEMLLDDNSSNSGEFGFADSNGPRGLGNNGCSPPPPEPSDFGVAAQKLNESASETLPTVPQTDVPETPIVDTKSKDPASTAGSSSIGIVDPNTSTDYVNFQYGEDGYLYFQDKEGNYYYQGEDGYAYRWEEQEASKDNSANSVAADATSTSGNVATEADPSKIADASGSINANETSADQATAEGTDAAAAETPTSWPGFPTGWPPQDYSSYYGAQYAASYGATGYPSYFPPYPPYPYGYYDYGSSSAYTKGPINLKETKFELSEEKKNATKSLVSRQLKVMASLKSKMTIKKPSNAVAGESGRNSAASESAVPKAAENGTPLETDRPELPQVEKRPSKFSDPTPMGTYGPPIPPKPIEVAKPELQQKSPIMAESKFVGQRRDSRVSRSPTDVRSNRYRSREEYSPDRNRKDERRGYGGDRHSGRRRDSRSAERDRSRKDRSRYSPGRKGGMSNTLADEKLKSRRDSDVESSDSDRLAKMGFGEKQIGGKQQEREQNNYTPTKPIEPESDERLLVKAADEGKDIEWPMAIVQKTRTEPKLTFSCKPDAYASFAALIKTQRVDEPAVVSEKQSSEDMELSDEETEEKSNQQPLGPKLPPAMVAPPPRTVVITGVKQPKISIGYPTISYPSIHAEKPVAVETQIVEKSATIELKKFGPVEPPPIAHKMVKSNFQPVTSAAMSISIEKPTIKDDSLNVVPAEFGGRSKAQMDAELERLRLEALASMENAKNVLAQVAKLSGKPQEDLTGVFMSPRKGQLSEKTSTSEEEEEEEGTKQKSKAKSKRDKKRLKQRKEKLSTKGKRKKQVEEDSGDEEMLEESSEDSSSESESEEETPPKRKTKKNRKQKKRTGKKHKAKGKSTKGKKKKMSESDEDENSSEEDSSESDESDVKQKKKKKKAIKDKRRRKHEETSESEESSEELARPSKKKRRQDHPEAVASAKEVLQDDEVPSMDEDEVEKKKTKGKKKGKAKRERSMSAEVKKKKRNKREPSSSSSDEEDKPIAKHRRNRPSESAGETAKSSKRASDSQQPTSQQNQSGTQRGSGDTHKDAECLVDEKAEQKRKSRWGVNADGQIKEPSDPANLPKPNIAHVLSLGKDGAVASEKGLNMFDSDLKPTTGSGLVSEYEMFENELFKSDPGSKEGAKVSLYDNIPGLGEESVLDENAAGSNNSHVVREIQSGTSAEREAAQMSLQEQRQLLARLESQHVDPNMRGVINQLKAALRVAENQLAERSGSKSMSEGSSIDASPSPSKDSKKSHQNKNEFSKAALESNKIKKKDQSKRHGKSRNASTERSSASPSPPPPPPPRRPAVEDPRIHKSTANVTTKPAQAPQPYFVTVATYRPITPAVPPPPALYKPIIPASKPATTHQSRYSTTSGYQRH